jgi:hypothetical protein
MSDALRQFARRLGIGEAFQKLTLAAQVSLADRAKILKTKASLLEQIRNFPPIPVGSPDLEIHMLLHHERIFESLWSLYSLCRFAETPFGITVHDDGSLTAEDAAMLRALFPGIRLIHREDSDPIVNEWLKAHGFRNSRRFRDGLVFGLKLFDPHVFRRASEYILLDSDVLFFRRPAELLDSPAGESRFSVDMGYEGGFSHRVIGEITGIEDAIAVNAGLLRLNAQSIIPERIEANLGNKIFWRNKDTPKWYAEQGLYGIELHLGDARPLSDRYQLSERKFRGLSADAIHFCGGGIKPLRLYTHGIPYLAELLKLPAGDRS